MKPALATRFSLYFGLLLAISLWSGNPVYAQSGMSQSCSSGGMPSSGTRGDGDDIQCRINNVLTSNQNLLNTMKSKASSCVGAHCDLVMDHLNRAQKAADHGMRANGRMKGSDYADLNTLRKVKCTGNNKDCASGTGVNSGGESDPGVGQDMADRLDEVTNAVDKANQMMQSDPSPASRFQSLVMTNPPATFEALYDYTNTTDDPDYPVWLHTGIFDPSAIPAGVRFASLLAAQANELFKEVSEDACKETVVALGEGGNTSLACTVVTLAARAQEALHEVIEFAAGNTMELEVDGAYQREKNLNDNLGQVDKDVAAIGVAAGNTQVAITQLQAQVTQLQSSVDALKTQLSEVENSLSQKLFVNNDMSKQIIQLLLSPDGNRRVPASLLSCTGDSSTGSPCPSIPVTCSNTTGVCSFSAH
jgi:hypothetical protein